MSARFVISKADDGETKEDGPDDTANIEIALQDNKELGTWSIVHFEQRHKMEMQRSRGQK